MKALFSAAVLLAIASSFTASGQTVSPKHSATNPTAQESVFPLHETSAIKVNADLGGVSSSAKCDADGNLYVPGIPAAGPLLASVFKIDPSGKVVATYNPKDFAQLALDRADTFTPASDGGLYQIAQKGTFRPNAEGNRWPMF